MSTSSNTAARDRRNGKRIAETETPGALAPVDAWIRRSLTTVYGAAAEEPVPDHLVAMLMATAPQGRF